MLALLLRSLLGSLVAVQAYVPARSVNETTLLNTTDQTSSIDFVWVQGTYHATLSLQLVADPNTSDFFPNPYAVDGIDRGALVHFSEDNARNNDTATTPWIAFISCDRNVTDASLDIDVFTLARDRGANAALLYSITSVGCMIEPEFRNDYEKPLNVFTTRSRSDAVLIESQFQYTTNAFYNFDAPLLNASYQSVTTLLNRTYPEASTYVCAVLAMSNATGTVGDIVPTATAGVPANGAGDGGGGGGGNKGTSLAMIILYAIAGVIIIIVAVVIYMGAMRAARNPDRYGPRAAGGGQARGYPYNYDDEDAFDDAFATRMSYATGGQTGQHLPAQTRTQGLARAIVDSFPLVKFARRDQRADGGTRREEIDGQQRPAPLGNEGTQRPRVERADESSKGSYLSGGEVESLPLEPMYRRSLRDDRRSATEDDTKSSEAAQVEVLDASPSGSTHYRRPSADGLTAAPIDTRSIGSAMGDEPNLALEETEEHCPICLLDFEDGDDMRVLPCEGSHQFHAVCIDQWLLEISSSCPLCRKDFSLLDTSSTTSLPLADSGQTTPPSGSAVSANVAPAPAPTAAAPSRTRIQGFLRRVRSTQVRPGQPPAASSSRGQRRPSNAETAARQHSIALSSAALF